MSRVGRATIKIPQGVKVNVEGNNITVEGPMGQLAREVHRDIQVELDGDEIRVIRPSDERLHRSLHGLTRSLVANMIEGVTKGFSKGLELVGTGYRASMSGNKLVLTLGFSHPVEIEPPPGIKIEVPNPSSVLIKGSDKELVGQFAARIRAIRSPEPYLGKGIRYVGEKVRRKVGKAGK